MPRIISLTDRAASLAITPQTFARYEQGFPTLTPAEIDRLRRFGEVRRYSNGELLFETGKPRGMHVILSGHVAASQRDRLGHVTPILDSGPGQYLGDDTTPQNGPIPKFV